MQSNVFRALLSGAALASLFLIVPSGPAHAQACVDFNGFTTTPVVHGSPWSTTGGAGFPPPGYFEFTNTSTDGNSILIESDPSGNNWLYFPWWECGPGCGSCSSSCITGSAPGALMIRAALSGVLPNYVSFYLVNGTGPGLVTAYDSSTPGTGNVIFQQNITQNITTHVVIENVGTIGRIEIAGGDAEDYIDDVCIDVL